MNRRGFLKSILSIAVVAALPACRKPESEFLSVNAYSSGVIFNGELGRIEGVRVIETPTQLGIESDGGYMFPDELYASLRDHLKQGEFNPEEWAYSQENIVSVDPRLEDAIKDAPKPVIKYKTEGSEHV